MEESTICSCLSEPRTREINNHFNIEFENLHLISCLLIWSFSQLFPPPTFQLLPVFEQNIHNCLIQLYTPLFPPMICVYSSRGEVSRWARSSVSVLVCSWFNFLSTILSFTLKTQSYFHGSLSLPPALPPSCSLFAARSPGEIKVNLQTDTP